MLLAKFVSYGNIDLKSCAAQALQHGATLNTEPEIDWRSRVNESSDVYGHDNDQQLQPENHTPEYDWRAQFGNTDDVYGQNQDQQHEIER